MYLFYYCFDSFITFREIHSYHKNLKIYKLYMAIDINRFSSLKLCEHVNNDSFFCIKFVLYFFTLRKYFLTFAITDSDFEYTFCDEKITIAKRTLY